MKKKITTVVAGLAAFLALPVFLMLQSSAIYTPAGTTVNVYAAVDTDITLENSETISNGTDGRIDFAANSGETLSLTLNGSNTAIWSSASGVTAFDVGDLSLACTAADLGDGALLNVGAIGADSLIPDGTALAIGDTAAEVITVIGALTFGSAGQATDTTFTFTGDGATNTLVHNHTSGLMTYNDDFAAANLTATTAVAGASVTATANVGGATLSLGTPTTVEYLLASHALSEASLTGEHHLYEVPAGKKAVVTKVIFHTCSASLNQDTDSIWQFGCNHGTSNDIIGATTMTSPASTTAYQVIQTKAIGTGAGTGEVCAEGVNGVFAYNVTTGSTSTVTCTVDVWGYLF